MQTLSSLPEEKQAIALLKEGQWHGLEVLVRLYQLKAIRAAALITADRHAAEDIVQNAFVRAAERIHQFDESRPFGPWFFRIVINESLRAASQNNRFMGLDDEIADYPGFLFDPSPLPEEQISWMEMKASVWQAIQKLSPRQRAAIVMKYYLEMSGNEISEELKQPLGTVKWWLHSAKQVLKKLLSPSFSAEGNQKVIRQNAKGDQS